MQFDTVLAGWSIQGRDELLPEAEANAIPAYEVHARAELPDCRQYRVLLSAKDGSVLALHQDTCGPLMSMGSE